MEKIFNTTMTADLELSLILGSAVILLGIQAGAILSISLAHTYGRHNLHDLPVNMDKISRSDSDFGCLVERFG